MDFRESLPKQALFQKGAITRLRKSISLLIKKSKNFLEKKGVEVAKVEREVEVAKVERGVEVQESEKVVKLECRRYDGLVDWHALLQ